LTYRACVRRAAVQVAPALALFFVSTFQLEARQGFLPLWILPFGWKTLAVLACGVLAVGVVAWGAYAGFNFPRGDAAGAHEAMKFRLPAWVHPARRAPR